MEHEIQEIIGMPESVHCINSLERILWKTLQKFILELFNPFIANVSLSKLIFAKT